MPPSTKRKGDPLSKQTAEDGSSQVGAGYRRHANVYDAVAGKISTNGFIKETSYGQNEAILTPDEVLFKATSAPERYAEDDFYWASRGLTQDALPTSDLLETLHTFAADYYKHASSDQGQGDFRSLDGSALLALGILFEESVSNILGETGDMAFVEGRYVTTDSNSKHENLEELANESESGKPSRIVSRSASRRPKKRRLGMG